MMLHSPRALISRLLIASLALCIAAAAAVTPQAEPQSQPHAQNNKHGGRRLQGRFLHITDVHPDPFYKTYSSTEASAACHRKRGPAGVYGAETSACDSPYSLVNATFEWIRENLKGQIDFVVWSGDSARHDNDEKIPRTGQQVIDQNESIVAQFAEVFKGKAGTEDEMGIPIVPTLGNNDVMPHNIFLSGPNKWSRRYLDIWRDFVPEEQRHSFQQGGWFFKEVVPGKLAVLSLNTLYFFTSNSAVDGCASRHEPGYEHLNWLRIQLQLLRDRNMKAILIGHVPPARTKGKKSWDETCWQKYSLWLRLYRDVIVGSLYGHMNVDHFLLQDFKLVGRDARRGEMGSFEIMDEVQATNWEDGEVTTVSASDYLIDLRKMWAKLPEPPKSMSQAMEVDSDDDQEEDISLWQWLTSKLSSRKPKKDRKGGKGKKRTKRKKFLHKIGGQYAERFSISHVSPSVVPNYFPTLRVFEYNITGLEDVVITSQQPSSGKFSTGGAQMPLTSDYTTDFANDTTWNIEVQNIIDTQTRKKQKKARKHKKKERKYKFILPSPPSKSAPPGPAYSPQTFTLLGYVQYFANLTDINNDFVEPVTESSQGQDIPSDPKDADFEAAATANGTTLNANQWNEGKHKNHQGKKPRPKPHPKKFTYEVEYDTRNDKLFGLKDLTVRRYVELAGRIGRGGRRKGKSSGVLEWEEDEVEDSDDDDADFYTWNDEIRTGGEEDSDSDLEGIECAFGNESCDGESDDDFVHDNIETENNNKRGKKKRRDNTEWYAFVKRAFVGTMDPRTIEQSFGVVAVEELGREQRSGQSDAMEL